MRRRETMFGYICEYCQVLFSLILISYVCGISVDLLFQPDVFFVSIIWIFIYDREFSLKSEESTIGIPSSITQNMIDYSWNFFNWYDYYFKKVCANLLLFIFNLLQKNVWKLLSPFSLYELLKHYQLSVRKIIFCWWLYSNVSFLLWMRN